MQRTRTGGAVVAFPIFTMKTLSCFPNDRNSSLRSCMSSEGDARPSYRLWNMARLFFFLVRPCQSLSSVKNCSFKDGLLMGLLSKSFHGGLSLYSPQLHRPRTDSGKRGKERRRTGIQSGKNKNLSGLEKVLRRGLLLEYYYFSLPLTTQHIIIYFHIFLLIGYSNFASITVVHSSPFSLHKAAL